MAIAPFLAMTASEMQVHSVFPPKIAWMACHFSPYGTGLSNLPKELPPGSLLMVDDITPPHEHDPVFIADQLTACVEEQRCVGVLLDFQRRGCGKTASVARHLLSALPCPVIISDCYADHLNCPVFLPPVPPSVPLETHIAPWSDRMIWLELGLDGEMLTLTEEGCTATPLPCPDLEAEGCCSEALYCHYSIETNKEAARFTLWRTKEDLSKLLEKAAALGITTAVGLFQELQQQTG